MLSPVPRLRPRPTSRQYLLCLANKPPYHRRIECDVIDKFPAAIAPVEDCLPCATIPRGPRWVVLAHTCRIALITSRVSSWVSCSANSSLLEPQMSQRRSLILLWVHRATRGTILEPASMPVSMPTLMSRSRLNPPATQAKPGHNHATPMISVKSRPLPLTMAQSTCANQALATSAAPIG